MNPEPEAPRTIHRNEHIEVYGPDGWNVIGAEAFPDRLVLRLFAYTPIGEKLLVAEQLYQPGPHGFVEDKP